MKVQETTSDASLKVVSRDFTVPEYFCQQTRANRIASMNGNNSLTPVIMSQEMVTTSDPNDLETEFPQNAHQVLAGATASGSCSNRNTFNPNELERRSHLTANL